jgi:hypothetical protein
MARAVPRISRWDSVKGVRNVAEKAKKKSRFSRLFLATDYTDKTGTKLFRSFPGLFIARVAEKRTFCGVNLLKNQRSALCIRGSRMRQSSLRPSLHLFFETS